MASSLALGCITLSKMHFVQDANGGIFNTNVVSPQYKKKMYCSYFSRLKIVN